MFPGGDQRRARRLITGVTNYGFVYGANRDAENDEYYWRITPFMMPFFTIIPGAVGNADEITYSGHGWVPADDENCWMFTYSWNASRPLNTGEHHPASDLEKEPRTMRATINKDNDYGIDREMQRNVNFTGGQSHRRHRQGRPAHSGAEIVGDPG